MTDQTATPGSHLTGPVRIEAGDPTQAAFSDAPASVTLTGTYATDAAAIEDALNALLERIQ